MQYTSGSLFAAISESDLIYFHWHACMWSKSGLHKFSNKSKSQLKILDERRLTSSRFHTGDPNILGVTLQNLIAWVTWHLGFVHVCSRCHFYDAPCNIITMGAGMWK